MIVDLLNVKIKEIYVYILIRTKPNHKSPMVHKSIVSIIHNRKFKVQRNTEGFNKSCLMYRAIATFQSITFWSVIS